MTRRKISPAFTLSVLVAVLASAAVYEAAVALRWLEMGLVPGEGPAGEGWVRLAAFAAALVASLLCVAFARRPEARPRAVAPLVAPAAVAFCVARFYTFDPYYLPTMRRMSEGGAVAGWWIVALVVAAALAAVLTRFEPKTGLLLTSPVLVLSALTAAFEGAGH